VPAKRLDDGQKVSLLECRKQFRLDDFEKVRNEDLAEVWKRSWKGVLKKGLLEAMLRSVLVRILNETVDEQEEIRPWTARGGKHHIFVSIVENS
jgi:hypothetical protein